MLYVLVVCVVKLDVMVGFRWVVLIVGVVCNMSVLFGLE